MNVLVTAASKHGSTIQIASVIGQEIQKAGFSVTAVPVEQAPPPAEFGFVVLGSAIYAGNWMKAAHGYISRYEETLRERPLWLFSSGPLGADNPQPAEDPPIVSELVAQLDARGHRNFVGSLHREDLNIAEKMMVKMVKAPYGDFRDWPAIRGWAQEIAATMQKEMDAIGTA